MTVYGITRHGQRRSNCGLTGKKLPRCIRPQYDHASRFRFVVIGHEPAFGENQRAKILIRRPYSRDLPGGGVELADLGHRALQLRAYRFHEVALVADEPGVVDAESDLPTGGETSDLRTGAPSPDDDQVLTQCFHPLLLVFAETQTQSNQQNDRRDAPDNPEHSQEAAHFMSAKGGDRLFEDVAQVHTSVPTARGTAAEMLRPSPLKYGSTGQLVPPCGTDNARDGSVSQAGNPSARADSKHGRTDPTCKVAKNLNCTMEHFGVQSLTFLSAISAISHLVLKC